jgi:hypothetical protein
MYRILKEANLVHRRRRRSKPSREEDEKATRPKERWVTDVLQIVLGVATSLNRRILPNWNPAEW